MSGSGTVRIGISGWTLCAVRDSLCPNDIVEHDRYLAGK